MRLDLVTIVVANSDAGNKWDLLEDTPLEKTTAP